MRLNRQDEGPAGWWRPHKAASFPLLRRRALAAPQPPPTPLILLHLSSPPAEVLKTAEKSIAWTRGAARDEEEDEDGQRLYSAGRRNDFF